MKENQTKTPKKLYKKWWFWVLSVLLIIIVLLIIMIVTVIKDPEWLTHTKYKINDRYCEQDNDCHSNGCIIINKYNFKKLLDSYGQTTSLNCNKKYCGSECIDNTCHIKNCEDIIE